MKFSIHPHLSDFVELLDAMQAVRDTMKQYVRCRIKECNIDITFEMLEVLIILFKNEKGLNQQEIAYVLRKNKATITSIIDNLSNRNLVVRTIDKNDRRNKIIKATPEANAYKEKIQPMMNSFYEIFQNDFSPEQVAPVTKMMRKMHGDMLRSL
ncbi:MarR family winged helix-turn-helix transcriptional regulator [Flavobacterium rhizosphaerae]|uniref:MarR family transcriptional regulator n=1 Tax=Flavobacterium rhizosphaerae TaxID=3163298 RepID=A0ABW8YRJ8_9FLAO